VPRDTDAPHSARLRALATGRSLTLAVGLCASLPVILATARALHAGWQPVADRAIIATRAFDVFSSHMPLVGQYSFAGTVTGHLTYSLGPMLYWLLAPAAHFGAPSSLALTMGAVNVGSILGAVALARRRGGRSLMFAAAAAIGLMCRSLAASNFYDIWNPSAGLFPLTLLMFACWSLACGEYRLAPLTVLVASFCAQCEDAFIPPSLALLGVGAVGLALTRGRPRRLAPRRRPDRDPSALPAAEGSEANAAERRRCWRWLLAALAVLLVCWTPTIADQLAGGGNLGLVLRAAAERRDPLGATVGARAVMHTVGVQPWWLTRPRSPWARKLDVRRPVGLGTSLSALLILGWLVLASALALRRGRRDVAAGAVLALALCAALWSIAAATPATPLLAATLGYTLWWATPAGMFVWLVAGWSALALLRESRLARRLAGGPRVRSRAAPGVRGPLAAALGVRGPLAAAVGVGAVALGAGVGVAAAEPDEHGFEFSALGAINARLGAVPSGHTVLLAARLDGVVTPLRPEITFALRRRGVRPLGSGAYLRLGHWYEKFSHPYDYVVWIYDHGPPPVSGAKLIARVKVGGQRERHTVSVVIAPVASISQDRHIQIGRCGKRTDAGPTACRHPEAR
jgi:hypothetical protein